VGGRRAGLVTVLIVVVIASSAAVLVLLTDVPLFLVYAVWIAPVVVLIPYAYPSAERRGYFDLLRGGRVSWMMLARNVILIGLFCSLLLELAARGRPRAAGPADTGTTG